MIAKIVKGKSFKGVVNYVLDYDPEEAEFLRQQKLKKKKRGFRL